MSDQQWDDPNNEGAARAAQLAAMAATLIESLARLRANRAAEQADADHKHAAALRADRLAQHAADRVTWTPAYDRRWLSDASTVDVAAAWAAAQRWTGTDADAADAVVRLERTLQVRHPEAMAEYLKARVEGLDAGAAMHRAASLFAEPQLALHAAPQETDIQAYHRQASHPRSPQDISADAYPIPTAVALQQHGSRQATVPVITSVPPRRDRTPELARR